MQTQNIPTHLFQDLNPLHFKIERVNHVNRYNPHRVHRHDYFEIFVFEVGGGYHLIDFEKVPIQPRQIHFVTPGQVHQMRRSPDSSGFVMLFSEEFFYLNRERSDFLFQLPFFYQKTNDPTVMLSTDEFKENVQIVDKMMAIFLGKSNQKKSVLQSYLNIFLCNCLDIYERQSPVAAKKPKGLTLFQQFQITVEQNFKSVHEVAAYGNKLATSPRQLNEICKKYSGNSAVEFIHRRLSLEAKRLLFYSEANINEIGFELGFEDPAHFSRFVRKCIGNSPSEWRKKHQE